MKPSEVIREARSLLFEKGWTQGELRGADGSLCLIGALDSAQNHAETCDKPFDIGRALAAVTGTDHFIGWNDAEGRTFDEVIDMLDRAEKIAEQQEALA